MLSSYGAQDHTGFTQGSLFADEAKGSWSWESKQYTVLPGFVDVHVHLREPGFSYKETITSGTLAAARGGYTAVCAMPNLDPVPDSVENLQPQMEAIRRDAVIEVLPYGSITKGEKGEALSDMAALAPLVAGFSDDGRGVQSESLMRQAMLEAKRLGKLIVAHCEDNGLLRPGGCVHEGTYAAAHGLTGISSESEWRQLERDLKLVKETGCGYHVCHVSTKESVELLRRAKGSGLDVTAETAPHYLLLNDSMLKDEGRYKMNPPVRGEADRQALLEAVRDGTIDMIATDHAPHTAEEKSRGLAGSLMGVVGLECAFPVLYTGLVRTGELSLERLVELMSLAPRRRFQIPGGTEDFCAVDLNEKFTIDPDEFSSMGRATPFAGREVYGRIKYTVLRGRLVWKEQTENWC